MKQTMLMAVLATSAIAFGSAGTAAAVCDAPGDQTTDQTADHSANVTCGIPDQGPSSDQSATPESPSVIALPGTTPAAQGGAGRSPLGQDSADDKAIQTAEPGAAD